MPPASPEPPRYRGLIFDLDGTLVDSYGAIAESLNHALQSLGRPTIAPEQVRRMVGHGLESLVAEAAGRRNVEAGVRLFRERYARIAVSHTRALPGVLPTLAALAERGYRMAVASNKPARFGRQILEALGMAPFLAEILGPDVVENPKPHPEMVQRLLATLAVPATAALYVGDMEIDVETCRAAGVGCWLVPTGSRTAAELAAAGGDRLLGSFADLLRDLPPLLPGA